MADSFHGGVSTERGGHEEIRARVAVQGNNIEALTGEKTFRIPIARCSLTRSGQRILVHDLQGSLVIWSDDEGFLDALARAQRGTLKDQVGSLRGAQRRRGALASLGKALLVAVAILAASIPFTRWAIRGGIPAVANGLGQSALQRLDLPKGVAPSVEQQLALMAEQLRPLCAGSTRSFHVLLADYSDVHSFGLPPDAIIITSGLVCSADDPNLVIAAVAHELAHLENHDVSQCVAESVDWHTPLDLVRGDVTTLRERMLDFADSKRSPGYTPAQEAAADDRALFMLTRTGVHLAAGQDAASLMARLKQLSLAAVDDGPAPPTTGTATAAHAPAPAPAPAPTIAPALAPAAKEGALDWAKVRAEACSLIGR